MSQNTQIGRDEPKACTRPLKRVNKRPWRRIFGDSCEEKHGDLLKDWDTEELRQPGGFEKLISALDGHYQWNVVPVLSEQIGGYLYSRPRVTLKQSLLFLHESADQ